MQNLKIGFIGGGNMASSLIGGLLADGVPAERIYVAEPHSESRARLAADYRVHVTESNAELAESCDVIVLAVKPQMLKTVCDGIADSVKKQLIISIAAGLRSDAIGRWLGRDVAIVRCMPNTPSLVQCGAAGLFANAKVNAEQRDVAESLMRAVGLAVWVDSEDLLDAVTAVSGSGPAYFFLFIEAMQATGRELGLSDKAASLLTLQTAMGAARMALESDDDAATLRRKVTSPNGTTEQAITSFEAAGLRDIVGDALTAARDRSISLSQELAGPARLEKDSTGETTAQ